MKNIYFMAALFLVCCSGKSKFNRVQTNKFILEGYFSDTSKLEGLVKYFDLSGNLLSQINYKDGLKKGVSINYYSDGKVSDSVNFWYNKETGYWRYYSK